MDPIRRSEQEARAEAEPTAYAIYGRATGRLRHVYEASEMGEETFEFYDVVPLYPAPSPATREAVTDREALDALPVGTVVVSDEKRLWHSAIYERVGPNGWWTPGFVGFSGPVPLPATILYQPITEKGAE